MDNVDVINDLINDVLLTTDSLIEKINKISAIIEDYEENVDEDLVVQLIILNDKLEMFLKDFLKETKKNILLSTSIQDTAKFLISVYISKNNFNNHNVDSKEQNVEAVDSVTGYLSSLPRIISSVEEERNLCLKISMGDMDARNLLIEKNLKYVVSIAKYYQGKGLSFLDLIQEGNLGLIEAVDRYDLSKGYRFTTYATHWIRQSILKALKEKSRNIKLTRSALEQLSQLKKIQDEFYEKNNSEASVDYIATIMNIKPKRVLKLLEMQVDTVSLNQWVSAEEDTVLQDLVADEKVNLTDDLDKKFLTREIFDLLDSCNLKEIEKEVLLLRNGFYGGVCYSTAEIGKMKSKSRQRIDAIEKGALFKLRKSPLISRFSSYMDNPDKVLEDINILNLEEDEKRKRKNEYQRQVKQKKKTNK